jgi:phosphate transport system substrate-binding protein
MRLRTGPRIAIASIAVGLGLLAGLPGAASALGMAPAAAAGHAAPAAQAYVPISGDGSSWAANAVDQWITDVHQYGMRVNYADTGSGQGRTDFLNHTVDFAVSDIPFQTNPTDGSNPEHPAAGSYAYMPIVAGGTSFMYHLTINGQRVTNLRLSGTNIAKIFTGVITNWNDPAIAKDNPALRLPNEKIIPVVRSDSSGSSAQFSLWMEHAEAGLWNAYYQKLGKGSTGGETSYWPTSGAMIAQSGDLGVAGYITQPYGEGAIGYVEYSYALNAGYPVAKMLNAAGYYTEPTATNVAVSLTKAKINTDASNPAVYLTQDLSNVYGFNDPRVYPMSSYSYMILPTTIQGSFDKPKGHTLGGFSYYFMCQGQQQASSLGYSPLPINLVEAGFQQIRKIPGVVPQSITVSGCNNPTFDPRSPNDNHLAEIAPFPPACDKEGSTQCTTGTAGARQSTPVSGNNPAAGPNGNSGNNGNGTNGAGGGPSGTGSRAPGSTGSSSTSAAGAINPDTGLPAGSSGGTAGPVSYNGNGQPVLANPVSYAPSAGWGAVQDLMAVVSAALVALVLAPPLLSRYITRGSRRKL